MYFCIMPLPPLLLTLVDLSVLVIGFLSSKLFLCSYEFLPTCYKYPHKIIGEYILIFLFIYYLGG